MTHFGNMLLRLFGLLGLMIWAGIIAAMLQECGTPAAAREPKAGAIHAKRLHKFKSRGRCMDQKTKRWIKGCH